MTSPSHVLRWMVLCILCAGWTTDVAAGKVQPGRGGSATGPDTLALTLRDAQRLAMTGNLSLLATSQQLRAAEGRLRQARVWQFNPEIAFESESPGSGGVFNAYEGEVSQEFEWAGQRGLRIRAAAMGVMESGRIIDDARRLTRAAAGASFLSGLVTMRRLELAEEILSLSERLLGAVSDQLEAGAISTLEANLAQIEVGRARVRVEAERRDSETAALTLKLVVGIPNETAIRLLPDLEAAPDPRSLRLDSLVAVAVARRPDLAAATTATGTSETLLRLSRRERLPNLRLVAPFDRLEGESAGQIGIGVGLSVPLWNRQQGTVAERGAELDEARLRRDAVEMQVRSEVAVAYGRYVSASDGAAIAETTVLGPARQNQALLDEAYRAGKIDLPSLLLLRNQLLAAELEYWDSWLASRLALEQLRVVTAEPLSGEN